MVQLQSSSSEVVNLMESTVEMDSRHDEHTGSETPHGFTALQLALNPSSFIYHGYETYIEDGLICLRHKIRNIEKKKLKLEGYKLRLENGEKLNQDQMEAVGRYEEVVQNLMFAKELQKTISALTQDLLKAQRKAVRNERLQRIRAEQKRLSVVLQMQYVLFSLQRQDVRKRFCNQEYADYLSKQDLGNLLDLASLVGYKRNDDISLNVQMEQASLFYLDLIDGKNKPVAGSTYKCLKEKLLRLVDCGFFDHLPDLQSDMQKNVYTLPDSTSRPSNLPKVSLNLSEISSEEKRLKKNKGRRESKAAVEMVVLQEVHSQSSLSKDPALRKKQLDLLIDQITGSFSFMQDSLLDEDASPTCCLAKGLQHSPGPSHIAQREKKKILVLPQTQSSTPINASLLAGVSQSKSLSLCMSDLELHSGDSLSPKPSNNPSDPALRLLASWAKQDDFSSSPLYHRESVISLPLDEEKSKQTRKQSFCNTEISVSMPAESFTTPPSRRSIPVTSRASFSNLKSVFSGEVPLSGRDELKTDKSGFLESVCLSYNTLSYSTASTQTPPELSMTQDDLQMESAYLSESDLSGTSQVYSPGQSAAPHSTLIQHYYPRNTVKAAGYEVHRVNGSGCFINQTHHEPGSVLYTPQVNGYQLKHKRGGTATHRNGSTAGWSDSSQVSSPEREASYLVDSAHGDSIHISAAGMPVTGLPPHALMPLYSHMRVAFSAARATNLAPGTLDQPIAFDLVHSNLGGAFVPTSGHFICPAAGTYVFFFHILKLAISVPLYVNLMRGDEVVASAYANDGAPDHETASNHALLPLRLGDHVWLRLHRGAIYGSSWKYSTFSGFLLYPD